MRCILRKYNNANICNESECKNRMCVANSEDNGNENEQIEFGELVQFHWLFLSINPVCSSFINMY